MTTNGSLSGDPSASENLTGQVSNPFALDSQGGTLLAGASGGVLATGLTATATGQTALQAILETGFLPSAGSTLAIAVGTLVPENLFDSGTEFRIDSNLRATIRPGESLVSFEQRPVDGEWQATGIFAPARFNDQGEAIGFEGLSPEDAELLSQPTGFPGESPVVFDTGGFEPADDDTKLGTLTFPVPDPMDTGAPGFPEDSGVPDNSVMSNENVTPLSQASRLDPDEIATGERLMNQEGITVFESPHIGAEFEDELGRSYDALGTSAASQFWNERKFLGSIDTHLLKSNDFTVIDLTDFTPDQIDTVRNYVNSLPQDSQSSIIRIGFD